jgi:CheY-like chemotaxis protein
MDLFGIIKHMNILLVDDDKWIRDSMTLLFEAEGCVLKALETAEEGLEIIKKQKFDIAIVDYRLPNMDGLEFLERIGALVPNIMRILITAYGDKTIFSQAKRIGVEEYITKPFSSEVIEESLTRLVRTQYEEPNDQLNERRCKDV